MADVLDALFAPRSVAVVGVSASEGPSWGRITLRRLLDCGFPGEVAAVARKDPGIPGVRCARSLTELAGRGFRPDLVVLATPAAAVPELVREARETGAGAALVFASGFAEDGGAGLQQELLAAAGEMPVLGPNCLGVVNRSAGLEVSTTAFLDRERPLGPGPVAIAAQSGALGFVLADLLERAGVGWSHCVSTGNEARVGVVEAGRWLIERPDTGVLVLYLEGVRDAAGLRALGRRAAELGKPVVALATGRSAAGRRAALSHTAAVAGDPLLLAALCRQEGIRLVDDDEQVVDAVLAATRRADQGSSGGAAPAGLPRAARMAVLTMSGGAGAVLADRLSARGLRVPPLSAATRGRLAEIGGIEASDGNPIDLGGNFFRSLDRVSRLLRTLDEDPGIDGIVLYLTFGDRFPAQYREIAGRSAALATPAWFVWACAPPGERERLGLPATVVGSMGELVRRVGVLVPEAEGAARRPEADHRDGGERRAAPGARVLTERFAGPLLSGAGIAHAGIVAAADPAELAAAVRAAGWPGPYAVKGDAADVPHRASAGLVELGVPGDRLAAVAKELAERLAERSADPEARITAQPMLPHGVELALGAVRDERYGVAVLLGAGGAAAEDPGAPRRALLLPAGERQIAELGEWAEESLGAPADGVARAVGALVRLLDGRPEITEVDVNPLCVAADGRLVAVDALITAAEEERTQEEERDE